MAFSHKSALETIAPGFIAQKMIYETCAHCLRFQPAVILVYIYPFGMQYVLDALNSRTTDRLPRALCACLSIAAAVKCTALLDKTSGNRSVHWCENAVY